MKMLPVLAAQEDLSAANVTAYGSASMKRSDARQWAQEKRRTATALQRRRRRPAAPRVTSPEEASRVLGRLGIPVVTRPIEEQAP